MARYFVTGIGTDVGKTIASACLVELLQADYWKPIQTGLNSDSDTMTVRALVTNAVSRFYPETYLFKAPVSPHLAASLENTSIDISHIKLPMIENKHLVIEGAGGLMVPLGSGKYVIDLIKMLDVEVILVCRNYLGCINHSLLSIDYLQRSNVKIKGLILNGEFHDLVREEIVEYAKLPVLFEIPELISVSAVEIKKLIASFKIADFKIYD